jgi:chromosomal replication initiation ATPase DnaA
MQEGLNRAANYLIAEAFRYYGVPIFGEGVVSRGAPPVHEARGLAALLLREILYLGLSDIADYLGGRHHSTITHSIERARVNPRSRAFLEENRHRLFEGVQKGGGA